MTEVLLCSTSPINPVEFERNFAQLGYHSAIVGSPEELKGRVSGNSASILVFEIDFLEMLDDAFLHELENQISTPFIVLSGKSLEVNVVQLKRSLKIGHIISQGQTTTINSLVKVLNEIVAQQAGQRMTRKEIRNLIAGDSTKGVRTFLNNSNERWDSYKQLSNYISKLPVFSGFDDIAATIASELITNAFYNGPRSEGGDIALYLSRKEEVLIQEPKRIEFSYWRTETDFWLMVVDPFGSLNKSRLVGALHRAVTEKTAKIECEGGAGLGLLMIADWASELFFGLCDQDSTWIACKLKMTKRRMIFSGERSNLHIYEVTGKQPKNPKTARK